MDRDPYGRAQYRHLIAWPERIRREAPLLLRVLGQAPSPRVLDLGSGPGDHARFLANNGFEVLGIDSSESMIEMSHEEPVPPNVRFVLGDFLELPSLVDGSFGSAICLGNALPHLTAEKQLRQLAGGLRKVLLPRGKVLLQILNYERLAATGERALPINFRPDPEQPDAEVVFVRVMKLQQDGSVLFFPTTLRLRAEGETPLEIVSAHRVELFGWRRNQIRSIFAAEGIEESKGLGDFAGTPFDPQSSRDLIWIGTRV